MARSLNDYPRLEVTFVTKEGALAIRMTDDMPSTVNSAAEALKARYVVCCWDWDWNQELPIWSVYDFRKAATQLPGGERSLPLPLKQFTSEKNDGAVMYALALQGGGS